MQFDQLERRAVLTGMAATAAAAHLPRRAEF
jgi:hypothetical protein